VIGRAYPSTLCDMIGTIMEMPDDSRRGDGAPCHVIGEVNPAKHNAIVGDAGGVQPSLGVPPADNDIACVGACVSETHDNRVIVENVSGVQDSAGMLSQDNHYEIVDDTPTHQALRPCVVGALQYRTLQPRDVGILLV
jgi:hypothetical protein